MDKKDCYIDVLINQVFSLLPTVEKYGFNNKEFIVKQKNLCDKIKGFISYGNFDTIATFDIISYVESLAIITDHKTYRSRIFRICSLLSSLKGSEVNESGFL